MTPELAIDVKALGLPCRELCSAEADKAAWLEMKRATGIGGSEAPIVMGDSPWGSRYGLYCWHAGLVPADDLSGNQSAEWGLRLEDAQMHKYAEVTSRRCVRGQRLMQSTKHPFMICTPDVWVLDEERGWGLLQIKTTDSRFEDDWAEEPPVYHQEQLQHELAVTGLRWGSLCCLIGGNRWVYADFERHDSFVDVLIGEEEDFWRRVEQLDPPEMDGSRDAVRALALQYPSATPGKIVELPASLLDTADAYDRACATLNAAKLEKERTGNLLRLALGDAEKGVFASGDGFTLKTVKKKGYTVEPQTFRDLRRTAP